MMAAGSKVSAHTFFLDFPGQVILTGWVAERDVAHGYREADEKISPVELVRNGSHDG